MHYLIETTIVPSGSAAQRELTSVAMALPDPAAMGITSRTMYVSLDGRTTFLIVETEQPAAILERFASMAPWVETRVTPVLTADEAGPAMIAAMGRIHGAAAS